MGWSKKSGHWKREEATTGDIARWDPKELFERPAAETGDHWGKWVYNKTHHTLYFDPSNINYEIRLKEIHTAEELADWLAQLSEKTWMTAADFGDFLEAIDDFIGLRSLAHPTP